MNLLERSLMTISCRDSDAIPKVAGAGGVYERDGERVQRMHNGVDVVYGGYHGTWMAHVIRGLDGHHEPQEELIFHSLLRYVRDGSVIVELGSFWGYYTQWYLKSVPDSHAVCVEPDRTHLLIGQRNAILNASTTRIRFRQGWVGGVASDAFTSPTESCPEPQTLPMFDATAVLAETAPDEIELLHLDIQGAELPFIESITAGDARQKIRFVMASTHHSSISGSTSTHVDCVDALRRLGATVLIEHDVIESFSGDGLILASLRPEDRGLRFPSISRNRAETSLFKSA